MSTDLTVEQQSRFWSRVQPTGFCWNWTGSLTYQGYGQFSPAKGMTVRAHRVAYELLVADPGSAVLDHLCRNRACVNPDHLMPTTSAENVLVGFGLSAQNARKEECDKGHEFTPENTYITSEGWRRCRTCKAEHTRTRPQRACPICGLDMNPKNLARHIQRTHQEAPRGDQ